MSVSTEVSGSIAHLDGFSSAASLSASTTNVSSGSASCLAPSQISHPAILSGCSEVRKEVDFSIFTRDDIVAFVNQSKLVLRIQQVAIARMQRNGSSHENSLCSRKVQKDPDAFMKAAFYFGLSFLPGFSFFSDLAYTIIAKEHLRALNEELIVPTQNEASEETIKAIASVEFRDGALRECSRNFSAKSLNGGCCVGECSFFLKVYFDTYKMFRDSEDCLASIAEIFSKGAPLEATFIQHLNVMNIFDVMHRQKGFDEDFLDFFLSPVNSLEMLTKLMQTLPDGVYRMDLEVENDQGHATLLFKNQQQSLPNAYFFEPNKGLYKLEGSSSAVGARIAKRVLYTVLSLYGKKPVKLNFKRFTPNSNPDKYGRINLLSI